MMTPAIIMNQSADYWHYKIGCNVIKANTKVKETFENWSQWQDQSIPDQLHEERKQNGYYSDGLAIIPGKIWRGPYTGKNLVAIDLDNRKAIEDFCGQDLEYLKKNTIVEQHSDTNKMHIYFIVERPIPDKSSDKTNNELLKKLEANEIPALEVKSNGRGIMFCSDSPHRNGSSYRIIGTKEPKVFPASKIEERITQVCKKYDIPYGSVNNGSNGYDISIFDLFKPDTKILKGHNRHKALLRVMDSLLARNKGILAPNQIRQLAYDWNQEHCIPPLEDYDFEKEWKQSAIFIAKSINDNNHFNGNGHSDIKNDSNNKSQKIESIIIGLEEEEEEGRRKDYFEYVVKSIKKTVKQEDVLIRQILYTAFSSYIEDDPINLGILAPTSEGKTYAITESLQYFSDKDVVYIGQMSPKVLVRQKGVLIDKDTGQPIEDNIKELRNKVRELKKERNTAKDNISKGVINEEIEGINEEIRKLFENSKTLIDLRGKILVFLEPPQHELWNLLKPILSHDKKEIEFPFVDKTVNSNAETKDVVVRGWPSCIFCSAKDESKWEIWNEIKSRILTTSPNMVSQKYKESKKLISQRKGLPNLIQQKIIISDEEIETTKNCVLLLKQKINELKSINKNHNISIWIPYLELLDKELPESKGTDVRYADRVFSLLTTICIVKSDLKMALNMEGQRSIIADLNDLKEVLAITQNFDGLPKFKAEFFNDIFLPCFNKKTEVDSNNKEDKSRKEEDIIAVTTRQLAEYYKEDKKKPIPTDNVKNVYLNQLINEGLVDYLPSKVDSRQNIYYPLVTEKIPIIPIMDPIGNLSQQKSPIYEKITTKISKDWIFSEIRGLVRYRLDKGTDTDFENYVNDPERFQILDNNGILEENDEEKTDSIRDITIQDFVDKYTDIVNISIGIQRSPN
jgi:hypothetical protein